MTVGTYFLDLAITSSHHFMRGLCHTLVPQVQSEVFSISGGYFLYLSHDEATRKMDDYGVSTSGFEIYIHDSNEILTCTVEIKHKIYCFNLKKVYVHVKNEVLLKFLPLTEKVVVKV